MNKIFYISRVALVILISILFVDNAYSFGFKSRKKADKADTAVVVKEAEIFHQSDLLSEEADAFALEDAVFDDLADIDFSVRDSIPFDSVAMVPQDFDVMLDHMLQSWTINRSEKIDCGAEIPFIAPTDSLYILRLARLPHIIEMPYNNLVRSLIDLYVEKRRPQLEYMLGAGEYYFPMFEEILEAYGLPLELKYLPVIESALNAKAVSSMGAAGLWQFMIATGRVYGLEVNSLIDERLDPVKATHAAARFLKDLYGLYGDWHLAIAAYNCGPGNVNKAIKRSDGKRDFWAIYPYLPRETRGYVPIFIAANYVMNYAPQHNICPAKVELPVMTDTIMITDRIHLEQVATIVELPIEELRLLNPQYRRDIIPGDIQPYSLCLPINTVGACLDNYDDILAYRADELVNNRRKEVEAARLAAPGGSGKTVYYKVRSGDTLGGIAKKYGVSVTKLRTWNNISGTRIYAGQRLKVYN